MLPSQRRTKSSQAAEVKLAADSGILVKFAFELICRHAGGRVIGVYKIRPEELSLNYQAGYMLNYFSK